MVEINNKQVMSYWEWLPFQLQHRIKMWALMKEMKVLPWVCRGTIGMVQVRVDILYNWFYDIEGRQRWSNEVFSCKSLNSRPTWKLNKVKDAW